jgi:hypothetical protein
VKEEEQSPVEEQHVHIDNTAQISNDKPIIQLLAL